MPIINIRLSVQFNLNFFIFAGCHIAMYCSYNNTIARLCLHVHALLINAKRLFGSQHFGTKIIGRKTTKEK